MTELPDQEGQWLWRRKRNQDFGFWENLVTGEKVGPVGLDKTGHAILSPQEAVEAQSMLADEQ